MDELELKALVVKHDKELRNIGGKLIEGDNEGFISALAGWLTALATSSPALGFLANKGVARLLANTNNKVLAAHLAEIEAEEEQRAQAAKIGQTVEQLLAAAVAGVNQEADDRHIGMVRILHNLKDEQTAELKSQLAEVVAAAAAASSSDAHVRRVKADGNADIEAQATGNATVEDIEAGLDAKIVAKAGLPKA